MSEEKKRSYFGRIVVWFQGIFRSTKLENAQPYQDFALVVLGLSMVIGLLGMLGVSITLGKGMKPSFWNVNLGLSVLIALAAAMSGGFLGFLFGIPRSLQPGNSANDNVPQNEGDDRTNSRYGDNTNLEQISDWLTKIIVGVGLVEIHEISEQFNLLVSSLRKGFVTDNASVAYTYTGAIIIYYSICGFMCVYHWARVYLRKTLNSFEKRVEKDLAAIDTKLAEQNEQMKEQEKKIKISEIESKVKKFTEQKNKILSAETRDEDIKNLLSIAMPGPVTYLDDVQKGRWGGQSERDGYRLSASVQASMMYEESFTVTLTVSAIGDNVLKGRVYFFLHDTYGAQCIMTADVVENRAQLDIESYEAFTVGALCNNGQVKLELDLNEDPTIPEEYKYSEALETISELTEKLNSLKAGTSI